MSEEQTNQPTSNNSLSTKVFVGNLSFRTRGPGLREAFEVAGKVEGVRVVTQGRRSMGYGFVQFATNEEAKKAVELLHKQPLDNREINVEVSTSSNTGLNPVKRRRPRARKAKTTAAQPTETTTAAPTTTTTATPTGDAPKKKTRKRTQKKKKTTAATPAAEGTSSAEPVLNEGTPAPRKTRARKSRVPREPKEPREPREFSDTVLYVSNIPFSLDDAGLLEAFKDFSPAGANIIRRNRTNLSKGFGFVEFSEASNQQAALEAKHKSKLGEREITVRKAHIRPPPTETPAATATESVEAKTE